MSGSGTSDLAGFRSRRSSRGSGGGAPRRRVYLAAALGLGAALSLSSARAQDGPPPGADAAQEPASNPVLVYLPNRIFDLFDVVRARVRVGPGVAVGARVTEAVDVDFGGYTSLFVGLPGPRKRPGLNLPIGIESFAGLEVSSIEATAASEDDAYGPRYGEVEVGAGFQLALAGVALGIDVAELVDFIAGLVSVDLEGDDY